MTADSWYRWQGQDLILNLLIQPRSSRDGLAEAMADHRKLRITAPPVDGKANRHLIAYLAGQFGVAKAAVSIESGEASRRKRIRISSPRKLPQDIPPPDQRTQIQTPHMCGC